ncbi:uncharacterized protein DUF1120 [Luteibacter sp. OK325]|uniref:DUF1120 domain-containing protein n=1 Tax=Luteibacter sp. OK325 TaxID=2135670 RepID=UPI000D3C0829|nr:DUF1120 domain-containing protein [Luteibacter sp. OK325]PTR27266.1 uncharacterized protein DUF1120 [Luteibacter sp. OK325]
MKYRPILLAIMFPVVAAASEADASSAELRVGGSIIPGGACGVTVGDGLIDLGRLKRDKLNATTPTPLKEEKVRMDINCGSRSRYALAVSSTSHGASNHILDFGLVSDPDHLPTGSLFIRFDNNATRMDGENGYVTGTDEVADLANAIWGPSTGSIMPISNGRQVAGFVTSEGSSDTPSYVKDLYTTLLLYPQIRPLNELSLNDDIVFSTDVSFEIRYF